MSKATARPWFVDGRAIDSDSFEIAVVSNDSDDVDGNVILSEEVQANAALIIRAVNSHDKLLAACKGALEGLYVEHAETCCDEQDCSYMDTYNVLIQAIEEGEE